VWPEYAGDSLLPRLREVLRDTISLIPGSTAFSTEPAIEAINSATMPVLVEILEVADDARLEGRTSLIDHDAAVQAAGTLRRIANRLAGISMARITTPLPRLDDSTESEREAIVSAIRTRLTAWLASFDSCPSLRHAAITRPPAICRDEIVLPLSRFISQIEAQNFAQLDTWKLEERRVLLSELQSLRRLEFLMTELDHYLHVVSRPAAAKLERRQPTSLMNASPVRERPAGGSM
jgi:hypothetical protein